LTIISRDSREVVITVSLSSLKKSNMVLMRWLLVLQCAVSSL
jgi:hypothetical protein